MIKKISYKDVQPLVEALKELGRIALIAIIPLAIDGLSSGSLNYNVLLTAGVIAILRALDKYVHLEGKTTGSDLLTGGLTRF